MLKKCVNMWVVDMKSCLIRNKGVVNFVVGVFIVVVVMLVVYVIGEYIKNCI